MCLFVFVCSMCMCCIIVCECSLERDRCPKSILETEDAHCLAKWLSLFTIEGKKTAPSIPQHPFTCCSVDSSALCVVTITNRSTSFDKRDVRFRDFHGIMESVFQSLHNEGVGAEIKHIPLITEVELLRNNSSSNMA